MTHEELLAKIDHMWNDDFDYVASCHTNALRAVVELHKPEHSIRGYRCKFDDEVFPCKHHQAIKKELK